MAVWGCFREVEPPFEITFFFLQYTCFADFVVTIYSPEKTNGWKTPQKFHALFQNAGNLRTSQGDMPLFSGCIASPLKFFGVTCKDWRWRASTSTCKDRDREGEGSFRIICSGGLTTHHLRFLWGGFFKRRGISTCFVIFPKGGHIF